MKNIVTLTMNPALDKSMHVDRVVPDRKIRGDPPLVDPGGGGINVSRVIKRLRGDSLAIFTAGGPVGEAIDDLLNEAEVRKRAIEIRDDTRESLTIFEDTADQEYRFIAPGPELTEEEWQRCIDIVFQDDRPVDYLVASGSLPRGVPTDFYARLAERAKVCGCRYIVDTSEEELRAAADAGVYLIKPNMRELKHLAGKEIETEEEQEAVAHSLVEEGKAEVVLVTLGAAGGLLVTADTEERIRAPTVKIRSKIGAGDSTVGGLVLALAQGKSVRDAAYYGIAAGSATVMTPGTELCWYEDVERLYGRMRSKS